MCIRLIWLRRWKCRAKVSQMNCGDWLILIRKKLKMGRLKYTIIKTFKGRGINLMSRKWRRLSRKESSKRSLLILKWVLKMIAGMRVFLIKKLGSQLLRKGNKNRGMKRNLRRIGCWKWSKILIWSSRWYRRQRRLLRIQLLLGVQRIKWWNHLCRRLKERYQRIGKWKWTGRARMFWI